MKLLYTIAFLFCVLFITFCALIWITAPAFAESITVDNKPATSNLNLKYGLGFLQSSNSQVVTLGYQTNFYQSFSSNVECGGWLDQNKGHNPSVTCAAQLGLRVILTSFYAESLHGVGFINHPDGLLGSKFEFFHDVGFGIRDSANNSLGLDFKHTSNAGLSKPNIGRNFIAVKVGFGL